MVVAAGADLMKAGVSNCIQLGMLEHAARLIPQAAIATTRFMTNTVHSIGTGPRYKLANSLGLSGGNGAGSAVFPATRPVAIRPKHSLHRPEAVPRPNPRPITVN
jgi:hypothetical protein